MPPLNGTKTHSLKPGSIAALRRLAIHDLRAHQINPGVRDRLLREALAEEYVDTNMRFYRITDAGRKALASLSQ